MSPPKNRTPRISDLTGILNSIAPPHLAESWDNVGLQTGSPEAPVSRILVALEATPAVVEEAAEKKASLLVTHHPLIFGALKSLAETNPIARLVAELVRRDIALFAAHTNLDSVAEGTNGEIADRLGLNDRRFLIPAPPQSDSCKYAVFVPASHIEAVIDAVHAAGAGIIGDYSHCTFRSPGTGTFKPLEGADPYTGKVGELTHADDEVRLETVCPRAKLGALIDAVREAHPYEEPAFDVYPLVPDPSPKHGLGLIGKLEKQTTLESFVSTCKKAFGVSSAGVVGEDDRVIRRVAVCSGAGGEAIRRWRPGTADVLVTGEMNHHACAEARDKGAAVVLVGHYASEVIVGERFAQMIRDRLGSFEAEVLVSEKETDPLRRV